MTNLLLLQNMLLTKKIIRKEGVGQKCKLIIESVATIELSRTITLLGTEILVKRMILFGDYEDTEQIEYGRMEFRKIL